MFNAGTLSSFKFHKALFSTSNKYKSACLQSMNRIYALYEMTYMRKLNG